MQYISLWHNVFFLISFACPWTLFWSYGYYIGGGGRLMFFVCLQFLYFTHLSVLSFSSSVISYFEQLYYFLFDFIFYFLPYWYLMYFVQRHFYFYLYSDSLIYSSFWQFLVNFNFYFLFFVQLLPLCSVSSFFSYISYFSILIFTNCNSLFSSVLKFHWRFACFGIVKSFIIHINDDTYLIILINFSLVFEVFLSLLNICDC